MVFLGGSYQEIADSLLFFQRNDNWSVVHIERYKK